MTGSVTGAATLTGQLRPNLSLSGREVHAASGPTTLVRGSVAARAGYGVLAANILADATEAYAESITQSSLNSSERDRIQGMLADVRRRAKLYQSTYLMGANDIVNVAPRFWRCDLMWSKVFNRSFRPEYIASNYDPNH